MRKRACSNLFPESRKEWIASNFARYGGFHHSALVVPLPSGFVKRGRGIKSFENQHTGSVGSSIVGVERVCRALNPLRIGRKVLANAETHFDWISISEGRYQRTYTLENKTPWTAEGRAVPVFVGSPSERRYNFG